MTQFLTRSRAFTLLSLIVSISGLLAPELTSFNPKLGKIVGIIGLVAAACGRQLFNDSTAFANPLLKDKGLRNLGLVVLTVLTLSLVTSACGENELRRAARISNGVSGALSAGVEVKRAVRQAGLIDDDTEREITRSLLDVVRSAKEFNDQALGYTVYAQFNRVKLLRLYQNLSSAAQRLASNGTLHIKNPQALRRFNLTLAGINVALPILEQFLQRDVAPEGVPITEDTQRSFKRSNATLQQCERSLLGDLERLTPQSRRESNDFHGGAGLAWRNRKERFRARRDLGQAWSKGLAWHV